MGLKNPLEGANPSVSMVTPQKQGVLVQKWDSLKEIEGLPVKPRSPCLGTTGPRKDSPFVRKESPTCKQGVPIAPGESSFAALREGLLTGTLLDRDSSS